jgi:DNA-binding HxlR family transcriptional regulator
MKKYAKKNIHSPIEKTLEVIGAKWTVLIIRELMSEKKRFGELEKALSGISPRTLSLRLGSMENHMIVDRKVYAEVPPRVEYRLTPLGKSLDPVLKAMSQWGTNFEKNSQKAGK